MLPEKGRRRNDHQAGSIHDIGGCGVLRVDVEGVPQMISLFDFSWLTLIKKVAPEGPPKIRYNPGMQAPIVEKLQLPKKERRNERPQ